jgi:phosphoglycolate phosphatase-like HAD superfamily hydrolase
MRTRAAEMAGLRARTETAFHKALPTMRKKLIVFDIDGTLLKSIGTHHLAMTRAMTASDLIHRDPEWANYANHTDSGVYYEAYEKSFGRSPTDAACLEFETLFQRCYDEITRTTLDSPMPGAAELLLRLEASGDYLVAFATGSYRGPALHKLQCLGVASDACFLATASEFRTREEIVADAVRRRLRGFKGEHQARMISVGDGPWDARTAAALGMHFVGVASDEKAHTLTALGAHAVVPDFADLPRFMQAIEIE